MYLMKCSRKLFQYFGVSCRNISMKSATSSNSFETVFSLPSIKYISILNRLKVYHLAGTSIAIPSSGALEMANIFPDDAFLTTSYIGITAAAVLCLATLPFRNIIGFLYISEDNQYIKMSYLNYWGKRIDKIIPAEDWIPLMDLSPKTLDPIYLTPQLTDGSKFKLFIRYGKELTKSSLLKIGYH